MAVIELCIDNRTAMRISSGGMQMPPSSFLYLSILLGGAVSSTSSFAGVYLPALAPLFLIVIDYELLYGVR